MDNAIYLIYYFFFSPAHIAISILLVGTIGSKHVYVRRGFFTEIRVVIHPELVTPVDVSTWNTCVTEDNHHATPGHNILNHYEGAHSGIYRNEFLEGRGSKKNI